MSARHVIPDLNRSLNFQPIKESFVFRLPRTKITIKVLYYSLLRITSTDMSSIQASHWSRKISEYIRIILIHVTLNIPNSFKVTILRYTKYSWAMPNTSFTNIYTYTEYACTVHEWAERAIIIRCWWAEDLRSCGWPYDLDYSQCRSSRS